MYPHRRRTARHQISVQPFHKALPQLSPMSNEAQKVLAELQFTTERSRLLSAAPGTFLRSSREERDLPDVEDVIRTSHREGTWRELGGRGGGLIGGGVSREYLRRRRPSLYTKMKPSTVTKATTVIKVREKIGTNEPVRPSPLDDSSQPSARPDHTAPSGPVEDTPKATPSVPGHRLTPQQTSHKGHSENTAMRQDKNASPCDVTAHSKRHSDAIGIGERHSIEKTAASRRGPLADNFNDSDDNGDCPEPNVAIMSRDALNSVSGCMDQLQQQQRPKLTEKEKEYDFRIEQNTSSGRTRRRAPLKGKDTKGTKGLGGGRQQMVYIDESEVEGEEEEERGGVMTLARTADQTSLPTSVRWNGQTRNAKTKAEDRGENDVVDRESSPGACKPGQPMKALERGSDGSGNNVSPTSYAQNFVPSSAAPSRTESLAQNHAMFWSNTMSPVRQTVLTGSPSTNTPRHPQTTHRTSHPQNTSLRTNQRQVNVDNSSTSSSSSSPVGGKHGGTQTELQGAGGGGIEITRTDAEGGEKLLHGSNATRGNKPSSFNNFRPPLTLRTNAIAMVPAPTVATTTVAAGTITGNTNTSSSRTMEDNRVRDEVLRRFQERQRVKEQKRIFRVSTIGYDCRYEADDDDDDDDGVEVGGGGGYGLGAENVGVERRLMEEYRSRAVDKCQAWLRRYNVTARARLY